MARKKQLPGLEERVKGYIQEHNLLAGGQRLLVAVSGGPDSVCMLHLLVRLKGELGVSLHVAHLDHGLRGAESEADAGYVAELARSLAVPAVIEKRDVRAYQKKNRVSLEEAAREVRYRFLADTAKAVGAGRVAVGHTSDDNVETILMHLVRGSGTRGLRGLQPYTELPLPPDGKSLTVVRPLLPLSRDETVGYCRDHQLEPRLDSTNLSLSTFRNRIRLQLLPLLEGYNPRVAEALLRTARIATDDMAFLDEAAGMLWGEIGQRQGNTIILARDSLIRLHPALKRNLLRMAIEELAGSPRGIEACHIEEVMSALDKPAGKQISLPGGLVFTVEYDRYLLGAEPSALCPFPALEGEFMLKVPGKTQLSGWRVEATIIDLKGEPKRGEAPLETTTPVIGGSVKGVRLIDKDLTACFDFDKSGGKLVVRSRRRGDLFQPLGLGQTKKVGQFMIDAKIPRLWRQRIPVVSSPGHIVWLVGWRIDDRVKVAEDTRKVLRLEFKRG